MAATTTLLGLVTPTQGTLSGTWGDTVNYGISDYVDIAIAGTLTFTGDGAITLANTTGSASGNGFTTTTAQYMVIRITGTQTVTKVITGPSYSKLYMVDHAGATSAVTFKAAGQTGVTVAVGEKCFVYYNGTDYVKVASSVADGVTTLSFGSTGLTPSTATSGAVTVAGTLATANGGTNLTSFTSGGVVYASSASVLATGSALVFDGTNLSNSGYYIGTAAVGRLTKSNTTGRNLLTGGVTGGTTDGAYIITEGYDYGGTAAGGAINLVTAGASSPITFLINGTEGMRLTSTGLGIGTSSPSESLTVVGGIGSRVNTNSTVNILGVNSSTGSSAQIRLRLGSDTVTANYGVLSSGYAKPLLYLGTESNHPVAFLTNNTQRMELDTSGNLGLGVTPSAWWSSTKTLQFGAGGVISGRTDTAARNYFASNAYLNSSPAWTYIATNYATRYEQNDGQHQFYTAASGTAGNAITFTQAMTLDAGGDLYLPKYFYIGNASNTASQISSGSGSANLCFGINGTEKARIDTSGNLLIGGTAARGTTVGAAHLDLFNGTAPAGTLTNGVSLYSSSGDLKFMDSAGSAYDVGFRNIPQNAQTGNYTMVLSDAGKHIYHAVGAGAATYTIPANGSVAYAIGTAITFINLSTTSISIAITTDTMYLSSAGTTGTRTLAQYGSATAIKVTSTVWLISGSGLT
jgi:hypothetical protein